MKLGEQVEVKDNRKAKKKHVFDFFLWNFS